MCRYAIFFLYFGWIEPKFAEIHKIHNSVRVRGLYLLVFRAKSRLAAGEPKSQTCGSIVFGARDADDLHRLFAAGDPLESTA